MSSTTTRVVQVGGTAEQVAQARAGLDAAGVVWARCGGRPTAQARQQARAAVLSAADVGIRVTEMATRLQTHRPTVYDMLKAQGEDTAVTATTQVVRQQKVNRVRLAREARDTADAALSAAIEDARAVGVSPDDIASVAGVAARTLRDRAARGRADA